MTTRLTVSKTYKLFIGGKFPRTESGRTTKVALPAGPAHVCRASRKDLRNAVEAAAKAQPGWSGATAYLRGQILYRMAEMLEGKRTEFQEALNTKCKETRAQARMPDAAHEVETAIDRLIAYAGWADKYAQVLGCNNPVAGPYYNFTVPEPTGVVGVICPDEPALLGMISLLAPPLCAGNAVIVLAGESNPIPAAILGEVCATSDVPPGVINILTGLREELVEHFASHRDIGAIHAAGVGPEHAKLLREGVAENLKRVTVRGMDKADDWYNNDECENPDWIEPFVEMKTVWHPSAT